MFFEVFAVSFNAIKKLNRPILQQRVAVKAALNKFMIEEMRENTFIKEDHFYNQWCIQVKIKRFEKLIDLHYVNISDLIFTQYLLITGTIHFLFLKSISFLNSIRILLFHDITNKNEMK